MRGVYGAMFAVSWYYENLLDQYEKSLNFAKGILSCANFSEWI